jgi:hypothetical protein
MQGKADFHKFNNDQRLGYAKPEAERGFHIPFVRGDIFKREPQSLLSLFRLRNVMKRGQQLILYSYQ